MHDLNGVKVKQLGCSSNFNWYPRNCQASNGRFYKCSWGLWHIPVKRNQPWWCDYNKRSKMPGKKPNTKRPVGAVRANRRTPPTRKYWTAPDRFGSSKIPTVQKSFHGSHWSISKFNQVYLRTTNCRKRVFWLYGRKSLSNFPRFYSESLESNWPI